METTTQTLTTEEIETIIYLNKSYFQNFKKMIEFECELTGRAKPAKIGHINSKDGYLVATCDFNGVNKLCKYPLLAAIYLDDKDNCWKDEIAELIAGEMAKKVGRTSFGREYELTVDCDGEGNYDPQVLEYFSAASRTDARIYFQSYIDKNKSSFKPGQLFAIGYDLHADYECVDTFEFSSVPEEIEDKDWRYTKIFINNLF